MPGKNRMILTASAVAPHSVAVAKSVSASIALRKGDIAALAQLWDAEEETGRRAGLERALRAPP